MNCMVGLFLASMLLFSRKRRRGWLRRDRECPPIVGELRGLPPAWMRRRRERVRESTHGQGSSRSVQGEAAGGPDLGSPPRAGAGPHVGRVSWQQQKRLVIMGPAGPRPDGFVNSSNFSPPRKEKEFALPASLLRCHLIVAVTLDTAHFFHLCFKTNPYLLKFINYTQT